MSSKDSMALAVGQAMLDLIAASAPEVRGIGDMDGDVIPADPDVDEPGTGVESVDERWSSTIFCVNSSSLSGISPNAGASSTILSMMVWSSWWTNT